MKKNNKTVNQKIKCDVNTCDFNNNEDNICNLEEIKISGMLNDNNTTDKFETICDSFKCNCDCHQHEKE